MYLKLIVFNRFCHALNFSERFWVTFYTADNKYYFIGMCIYTHTYTQQ